MLDDEIVTVPAGWYPDPMGLPQLRWWDNYAWTEFTSAARTPLIMQDEPRLAYADDDLPSRRAQREQRDRTDTGGTKKQAGRSADFTTTLRQLEPPKPHNVERNQPAPTAAEPAGFFSEQEPSAFSFESTQTETASEAAYDPFAEFLTTTAPREPAATTSSKPRFDEQYDGRTSYTAQTGYSEQTGYSGQDFAGTDFGRPHTDGYGQRHDQDQRGFGPSRIGVHAPLAYTPFVWMIAMIPLIQLVGILLVVSAVDISRALPFLAVIALSPYVATIPLAIADRAQLLKAGHRHPAHWAWSILTAPAYLVARAIAASREYGKGLTPLLVWASLSLLQVVSVIAVPGILISAAPAVFSAEVEDSIEAYSAIAGRQLAVDCPATPPTQIGGTFNCVGVELATQDTVGIVVRLQRANGWIDWRVYGMVWDKDNVAAPVTVDEPTTEGETVAP